MTSADPDGPWATDEPWTIHPGHPLVDDASAVVLEEAIVELTLLRSPMSLGDGLADLHAIVSLLAQLRAWMPVSSRQPGIRTTPGRRSPASSKSPPAQPDGATAPISRPTSTTSPTDRKKPPEPAQLRGRTQLTPT